MDPQHFIQLEGILKNLKVLSLKHKPKIELRIPSSQMTHRGKCRTEPFVLFYYRNERLPSEREENPEGRGKEERRRDVICCG